MASPMARLPCGRRCGLDCRAAGPRAGGCRPCAAIPAMLCTSRLRAWRRDTSVAPVGVVGVEAVGQQVQLAAVELRGQLDARDARRCRAARGRPRSGPGPPPCRGRSARRSARPPAARRRCQRLRRLLAVAEDGVAVEVDVRGVAAVRGCRACSVPGTSQGLAVTPAPRSGRQPGARWPRHVLLRLAALLGQQRDHDQREEAQRDGDDARVAEREGRIQRDPARRARTGPARAR